MEPPWKTLKGVSHFAHSSGDGSIFPKLTLFCDKPDVEAHADSLGVPDEGSHVDVLGPSFGAAELRGTGADLLGEFGLGESLPLPLIGELEIPPSSAGPPSPIRLPWSRRTQFSPVFPSVPRLRSRWHLRSQNQYRQLFFLTCSCCDFSGYRSRGRGCGCRCGRIKRPCGYTRLGCSPRTHNRGGDGRRRGAVRGCCILYRSLQIGHLARSSASSYQEVMAFFLRYSCSGKMKATSITAACIPGRLKGKMNPIYCFSIVVQRRKLSMSSSTLTRRFGRRSSTAWLGIKPGV